MAGAGREGVQPPSCSLETGCFVPRARYPLGERGHRSPRFRGERLLRGNPAQGRGGDGRRLEIPIGVQGLHRGGGPLHLARGHPGSQGSDVERGHPTAPIPRDPPGSCFSAEGLRRLEEMGWGGDTQELLPPRRGQELLVGLPPFVGAPHPPLPPRGAGEGEEALERVRKLSPRGRCMGHPVPPPPPPSSIPSWSSSVSPKQPAPPTLPGLPPLCSRTHSPNTPG